MGLDAKFWMDNARKRDDMSVILTHFTRATASQTAEQVLAKILREKKLIGSTTDSGFIVGSLSATCFTAAPLISIARYKKFALISDKRFSSVGLLFSKRIGFHRGCRPVLYERRAVARQILPADQHWRIVNMDLSIPGDVEHVIDFSHEREWRCCGDFSLEGISVYLIFPDGASERRFRELDEVTDELMCSVTGTISLNTLLL